MVQVILCIAAFGFGAVAGSIGLMVYLCCNFDELFPKRKAKLLFKNSEGKYE